MGARVGMRFVKRSPAISVAAQATCESSTPSKWPPGIVRAARRGGSRAPLHRTTETMIAPHVNSPRSLADAYRVLAGGSTSPVSVIAGGTDLMVLMNAGLLRASAFLDIWRIPELRGISEINDRIRIGATTTFTQIAASSLIHRAAPALVAAARTIGAIQIQNRATIGGNIVNGSPAGDSLP